MMPGSSSGVPLVRCPKCGHLLPELPPYSVYCCGGCGAYLRAEKGSSVDDVLSQNSVERTGEGPTNSQTVRSGHGYAIRKSPVSGGSDARSHSSGRSGDEVVRVNPLTEIGMESQGKSPARSMRSVRGGVRKIPLVGESDEQRSMGSDSLLDYEEMKAREKVGAWFDHVKEETGHSNRSVTNYETRVDESESLPRRRTWGLDEDPNEFRSVPRGVQIVQRDDEYVVDLSRRPIMEVHREGWVGPGGDYEVVPRGRGRYPAYPNEGPSYYGYDQPRHYQESYAGSSSLQSTEVKRAELFRLYNDLKEELSIAGDHPENYVRRGHHRISSADRYGGREDYPYDDEPLRLRRPAPSVDLDDRSRMGLRYVNRGGPQTRFGPNEFPYDDDPSWPQYPQRTPHHQTNFHPREYIPRRYPNYQNSVVAAVPDPYDQNSSGYRVPHTSRGPSSHSRSSVESKSDGGGSFNGHNKRVAVLNKNQIVCRPIDGAAPFVMCRSCSNLLRLPKKLNTLKKTQVRLQCGSCQTTLSFDFGNKKPRPTTQLLPKLNSSASETDGIKPVGSSAGLVNRESFDFDATGYTFPSTDSEPSMQLDERRLNSIEAQKQQGLIPSSSNASKVELNVVNAVGNKPDDSIPLVKKIPLRPPPGAPLQEHFEYSALFSIKQPDQMEADAPGYDREKTDTNGSYLDYKQITDGMADMEIKSNEILTLDMSQNFGEVTGNDDRSGNKKSEFSFFGRSGRRSGDYSLPPDALSIKDDVFVNGQHLAHREVKKAEKLAGPISPGRYWYDSRAGFWGVMGGCCLGIIPPFIEEFGSPMPVDCAGGTTGICVNGRELHERDLELLSTRGLPRTTKKSYVIDISGKVEDEDTGDIVARLGKLAPTVEKTKRGFGMQPPEVQEE